MPNWVTLFGNYNRCASKHCQTVFSPAAYLVDLLQFIGGGAKSVLFQRRPDVADIELTCANTNRLVPYIDLVNEVLENAINPLVFGLPHNDELAGVTNAIPVDQTWEMIATLTDLGFDITPEATVRCSRYGDSEQTVPIEWVIEDVAWRYTIVESESSSPLQYISFVSPQTSEGEESLEVYPEHTNPFTYRYALKNVVFPFNLPFDLAKEEIHILLSYLRTPKHEILETFSTEPLSVQLVAQPIAAAYLNLSGLEIATILHHRQYYDPDSDQWVDFEDWKYWGFLEEVYLEDQKKGIPRPDVPSELVYGTWTELLSMIPFFMHRSGLRYEEVLDVVDMEFVNKSLGDNMRYRVVSPNEKASQLCNINDYKIVAVDQSGGPTQPLDLEGIERLRVFIRLWRLLGWEMRELDQFLMDFHPDGAGAELVDFSALYQVKRLHDELNVPVLTILSWWKLMNNATSHRVKTSLYDEVFLVGNPDEYQYKALRARERIPLLYTADQDDESQFPDFAPILRAALGISSEDYDILAKSEGNLEPYSADPLVGAYMAGLTELTKIYRTVTFCEATNLSVEEFYRLREMFPDPSHSATVFNPFTSRPGFEEGAPVDTYLSIFTLEKIRRANLSIRELDYLLRHQSVEGDSFVPKPQEKADLMLSLNQAMRQINAELPENVPVTADNLVTGLGYVVPGEKIPEALAVIEGPADPDVSDEEKEENYIFIHRYFAAFFPTETAGGAHHPHEERLVEYNSALNDADPITRAEDLDERYRLVWDYLLPYVRELRKTAAVLEHLSRFAGLDSPLTSALLQMFLNDTMLETPDSAPAMEEWKQVLLGGWMREIWDETNLLSRELVSSVVEAIPSDDNVTRWRAYLIPEKDDTYRFALAGDAGAAATIHIDGKKVGFDASCPLKASSVYAVTVDVPHSNGPLDYALEWAVGDEPRVRVPRGVVVPADDRAVSRIHKAAHLVQVLKLDTQSINYLTSYEYVGSDLLDFNRLPIETVSSEVNGWEPFDRLLDYVSLNNTVPLKKGSLFEFLNALVEDPDNPPVDYSVEDGVGGMIREQTGWAEADLQSLVTQFSLARPTDAWDWMKLQSGMSMVRRMKVPAADIIKWFLGPQEPSLSDAKGLRNALKSRFSQSMWKDVFKPLRDPLRQKQRDVLVGYLLAHPLPDQGRAYFFKKADLYSHYLIDTAVEPDVLTSRIKLGIGAIQLFVHRVFLGFEKPSYLPENARERWEWMKNYRVWEANRKVFLYPENWLEPELRDDKSEAFLALEDELLQEDATNEKATVALHHYVDRLNEVSALEVIGAYEEAIGDDKTESVLHVVARSQSTTRTHYIRQRKVKKKGDGFWTPWKTVDVEINSESVLPIANNGRLFLFWPFIQVKEKKVRSGEKASEYVEIKLMWSELNADTNRWEKPRISKKSLYYYPGLGQTLSGPSTNWKPEERLHYRGSVEGGTIAVDVFQTHVDIEGYILNGEVSLFGTFLVLYDNNDVLELPEEREYYSFLAPRQTLINGASAHYFEHHNGFAYPLLNPLFEEAGYYSMTPPNFAMIQKEDNSFFLETHGWTLFSEQMSWSLGNAYSDRNNYGTTWYRFETFHHPHVRQFQELLSQSKLFWLMHRLTQALPATTAQCNCSHNSGYSGGTVFLGYHISGDKQAYELTQNMFELALSPKDTVNKPYPLPTVEFKYGASFGVYNWELFFHVPLIIADHLRQNRQYADAMKWLHYIFNPGQSYNDYELSKKWIDELPPGSKYWTFLPFFSNKDATRSLLDVLGLNRQSDSEFDADRLTPLIDAWKDDPFNPHLIARSRIVAYQKAVVMKYLDNLIEWGDQLFRMDTMESINEATQLYIVAAEILGDRPEPVKPGDGSAKHTYNELSHLGLLEFSNAVIELEDLMRPKASDRGAPGKPLDDGTLEFAFMPMKMFYFKVPMNEKLGTYFDIVQDRLFKIRNSLNIDGIKRQLPLFQPPIDPALLVKAAAAGLDLGSVLQQLNAPMPHYRFNVWIQKASELANEVRSFGQAILSALEKKDGEDLQRLRSGMEIDMLKLAKEVRKQQIKDAEVAITSLLKSKALAETRRDFYRDRQRINSSERHQKNLLKTASILENVSNSLRTTAGFLGLIPQFHAGPLPDVENGGVQIAGVLNAAATAISTTATSKRNDANLTGITAGYERRAEDWSHQADLALKEMALIDQQIIGAEIRLQIAEKELSNHEAQIEHAEETLLFMKEKFTSSELYQWMAREVSKTHTKLYKLAFDVAKTAERTYKFELGEESASFIEFTYLDSLRKDLLAGEKLVADIKRLDVAYLEKNKREYEITKPFSLRFVNANALQELRETGSCEFDVPEVLYDLDFPGHYYRRIKSVSLTIPCVPDANSSVSAKLTLLKNCMRRKTDTSGGYLTGDEGNDARFAYDLIGIQSIATSDGRNDAGVFEFNFRDDRYLPFEGAGAISRWRLELPTGFRQFDYNTIADVIMHMSYTAREGGEKLKQEVNGVIVDAINSALEMCSQAPTGLYHMISLKRKFPNEFHRMRMLDGAEETIEIRKENFPYIVKYSKYTPVLNPDPENSGAYRVRIHFQTVPVATLEGTILLNDVEGTIGKSTDSPDVYFAECILESDRIIDPESPWRLSLTGTTAEDIEDIIFIVNYRLVEKATD